MVVVVQYSVLYHCMFPFRLFLPLATTYIRTTVHGVAIPPENIMLALSILRAVHKVINYDSSQCNLQVSQPKT